MSSELRIVLGLVVVMGLGGSGAQGQGSVGAAAPSLLLEATGSEWLHSGGIDLESSGKAEEQRFECRFGFSTQEKFVEGLPADMLSAVLLDATGRRAMVLFTISAEGFSLMPLAANSLSVSLDRVLVEELPPPASEAEFAGRFAYRLNTPLPASFASGKVRLALALFDNQDGVASRAWVDEITLVPEPSSWSIFLLTSAALAWLFSPLPALVRSPRRSTARPFISFREWSPRNR